MSTIANLFTEYPVVPLFLMANLAIGIWAYMKSKAGSFEDYALASRSLPTAVLAMTVLATMMSTDELIRIDATLEYGVMLPIIVFFQFMIPALLIIRCIVPRLVFFKGSTFGSCMGEMYGEWIQVLAGIIQVIFSIGLLSAQLVTIGIVANKLMNIDVKTFVVFFGVAVALYSVLGGMRSVSYTDVLQLIAVLGVFFLVTQKAMLKIGGIGALINQVATGYENKLVFFSHPDLWLKIRGNLYWNALSFAYILSPPIVHRMLILKEPRKLTKVWYTTSFVYAIVVVMITLIGLFGIVHQSYLGLTKGSNVLVHVIQYLFYGTPWMMHLMTLGIISILMSTMDSYLHTLGIICVEDILAPMQKLANKKGIAENRQVILARISILVIGALAIVIGLQLDELGPRFIGRKLIHPVIAIQVIVMIPFILGVMGFKPTQASFISFAITYLGIFYGQKLLFPWQSHLAHRGDHVYFLVALPIGILAFLVAHVYKHKGIAIVYHSEDSTSEKVWVPSWTRMQQNIGKRLYEAFDLVGWSRLEGMYRPMQSLVFSMVMFAVYALYSLLDSGKGGDALPEFMAGIYIVGMVLCCGLMLEGLWPRSWKPYFSVYWLATLWYCLPLGGTITFLRMHEGLASFCFLVGSFVLLALLVTGRTFLWMSVWGLALAHGGWYVFHGSLPADLWASGMYGAAWLVVAVLIAIVWVFGDAVEQHVTHRLYVNQALAGAVTHETMVPLQEVANTSMLVWQADQSLTPIKNASGEKGFFLAEARRGDIIDVPDIIDAGMREVSEEYYRYKELLKNDIYRTKQDKVSMLKMVNDALPNIAKRYQNKVDIKVTCRQDFEANMLTDLFDMVLRNLVKNARRHGAATKVEIIIDGAHRKIFIHDNGIGISPETLPRIFDLGFTTKPSNNYGIGLALVRLILDVVGAKIVCRSRHGGKDTFTEFVIVFPTV